MECSTCLVEHLNESPASSQRVGLVNRNVLCVNVGYAGCSLGRHALQGLDKRLLQLLSLGQERGDVKNILIYGRNGVGKSTLIQSILRLGEAPQVGVRRLESCEPCHLCDRYDVSR